MLINYKNEKENHVKFISYTGDYPNLCRGVLTLDIDGIEYKFGHDYCKRGWEKDGNYQSFWSTNEHSWFDSDLQTKITYSEWVIDVNQIPEKLKKYALEIDKLFNENVKSCCCGGCW